jgi:hypothetical protein
MVIFAPQDPPRDLPQNFTWIPGDPIKESELDKVRLAYARTVIVTGRRDGRTASAVDAVTMLTIFTIRSYDEVVLTAGMGLSILAHTVAMPGTGTALGLLAARHTQNLYVGSIPTDLAPAPATFGELVQALKDTHDVLVIGVKPPRAERIVLNPKRSYPVDAGFAVIYLSNEPKLGDDPLAV